VVRTLTLFIFCIQILPAVAKTVEWKSHKFNIDLPKNWREAKDLYGIPVTLLGPSVSSRPRAIVQVIPTDAPFVKMSEADARSFGEKYAEGRKAWVRAQGGELYETIPGKFEEGKLTAGVSYRLNQKSFLERTYYVNCPKKLYHLKIVLNFENKSELSDCESIVRSFSCAD
jgi:hypothetical protein